MNDAQARFLLIERSLLPLAEQLRAAVPSIEVCFLLDGQPDKNWLAPENYDTMISASPPFECDFTQVDEDSIAELFYTSGSSDRPKGVMLTHRNVYLHALSLIASTQTSPVTAGETCCKSVLLHTIPLFHANGWGSAHTITLVGGTHVMLHQFFPVEVFRLIQQERVTTCAVVPTMLSALVHSPERSKYDLSSLKLIMTGGAASNPALVKASEEAFGCPCFGGYGLTETCPVLTKSGAKLDVPAEGEHRHARHAMTGYAIPGAEIKILGLDGNPIPHNGMAMGEIVARGDGVMDGYWRQPQATEAVMDGGWFHTGDIATIDPYNYVQIADRKKEIIVSGGENISSLEVEKTLAAHTAVYEVAVIPVPDDKWGEVPKALVVLKPGTKATEHELIEFCRVRLSHYKCPRSVEFRESLPKTGTGKILKRELRQKYWATQKSAV
jgi:fatty-acyl-CoA synthase